jgi:hypothetical protein
MIEADVLENTTRGTSTRVNILPNFRLRWRTPLPPLIEWPSVTTGWRFITPLGRILRNFRFRMHTPKGTPKGSRDLRSLLIAMVFLQLYYYYSKKKVRGKKPGMRMRSLPVMSLPVIFGSGQGLFWSCDFRSRHFRSGPVTWLPVAPQQMLFCPYWYTTIVFAIRRMS